MDTAAVLLQLGGTDFCSGPWTKYAPAQDTESQRFHTNQEPLEKKLGHYKSAGFPKKRIALFSTAHLLQRAGNANNHSLHQDNSNKTTSL